MKKCACLFFLALLGSPVIAYAEIVKCIDHGQVTYRNGSCNQKNIETVPDPNFTPPIPNTSAISEPEMHKLLSSKPVVSPPVIEAAAIKKAIVSVAAPTSFSVPLQNGSYFVSGTVGGIPTKFQIDTGASNTAVSQMIADQAGYFSSYCPAKVEAATANGMISVCLVTIPELSFGKFTIKNVAVIIMPNMQQEALLGMDILQNYIVEQRARVLKISH